VNLRTTLFGLGEVNWEGPMSWVGGGDEEPTSLVASSVGVGTSFGNQHLVVFFLGLLFLHNSKGISYVPFSAQQ
jgi:hypothetical protein